MRQAGARSTGIEPDPSIDMVYADARISGFMKLCPSSGDCHLRTADFAPVYGSPLCKRLPPGLHLSSKQVFLLGGFLAAPAKAAPDSPFTAAQREVLARERVVEGAGLELPKGKNAFPAGDAHTAVSHLTRAIAQQAALKPAVGLMLLRAAHSFLRSPDRWHNHACKLKAQS